MMAHSPGYPTDIDRRPDRKKRSQEKQRSPCDMAVESVDTSQMITLNTKNEIQTRVPRKILVISLHYGFSIYMFLEALLPSLSSTY